MPASPPAAQASSASGSRRSQPNRATTITAMAGAKGALVSFSPIAAPQASPASAAARQGCPPPGRSSASTPSSTSPPVTTSPEVVPTWLRNTAPPAVPMAASRASVSFARMCRAQRQATHSTAPAGNPIRKATRRGQPFIRHSSQAKGMSGSGLWKPCMPAGSRSSGRGTNSRQGA